MTLNDLKHLPVKSTMYILNTHPQGPNLTVLLYNKLFLRYKIVENWKCTEWPQNNLSHLTVNSNLYTLNTNPWGPNFTPFRSMTSRIWDTSLLKIRNASNDLKHLTVKRALYTLNTHPWGPNFTVSLYDQAFLRYKLAEEQKCTEWLQNDLNHLTVKRTMYTLNTHPKFHSVSLYDQPFLKYKLAENQKCIQWPHNDLNHLTDKSTLYTLNTHPWGPKCTPFRSTFACFSDNWGFLLSHRIQWWISKFIKNLKLKKKKISKIQNSTFVRATRKNIQERLLKIQKWCDGRVAFWSFGSHRVYVNDHENKVMKNQKPKISKIQNSTFVRITKKIIQKSLKRFKRDLREE